MSSPPTSPELPKYAERVAGSRPQGMEAKLAEALDNEWKRTEECREKEREICELRKRLREFERDIERGRLLGSGENEGDDVKLMKEMRSLEEQVDEWKDKEVEALTRVRELEGERDRALEEARCLEEKLQQERQKRLALERAEEELRTQCKQLEKKISVLREENSTLEDEKQMAIEGHSAVCNRLYNVQAELDSALEELRTRRGRSSTTGICSLEAELEGSTKKELEQLRSTVQKLQSELRATDKDAVARLKAQLGVMHSWKSTAESARRQVLETIAERDRRVKMVMEELRCQEDRVEVNASTVCMLEKMANTSEQQSIRLRWAMSQLEKENEWMREKMKSLEEEIDALHDRIYFKEKETDSKVHNSVSGYMEAMLRLGEVETVNVVLSEMIAKQRERLRDSNEMCHRARKLEVMRKRRMMMAGGINSEEYNIDTQCIGSKKRRLTCANSDFGSSYWLPTHMSIVSVTEVSLLGDNPCKVSDKLSFEIQFEALKKLKDDLEWAMVYVADANDSSKDQELDTVELGPVEVATMKFTFEAPAPDLTKVSKEDVLDVTGIFISATYQSREFCRIGFYLKHEYDNEEMNNEPPEEIDFTRLLRRVDVENPRITKYVINWDEENEALQQPYLPDASAETGDGGEAVEEGIAFDTAVPLDKGVEVEVTDDEDEPDNDEVECNEPDEAPVDNLEQMETSEVTEAAQDMKVDPVGQSKIDPVAPSESIAMDVDVAGG